MIVPKYWAESRVQHHEQGKQVTIRRFGWSQTSGEEAQANADARAAEALRRTLAGERLAGREPKVPYNGAEGLPIREEIVAEHGETVITRNSYGALCLNTPNVLFGDIDFDSPGTVKAGCLLALLLLLPSIWLAWQAGSFPMFFFLGVASVLAGQFLAELAGKVFLLLRGGPDGLAARRVQAFAASHPDWRLRIYRTPNGLRVLVMHRTFKPEESAVDKFFKKVRADPTYVKMCRNQRCFRSRVSPKPWRMGIASHVRLGVWPVRPDRLSERNDWLKTYDEKAAGYASCRFERELGNVPVDPFAQAVQRLHDQLSKAESELPIA